MKKILSSLLLIAATVTATAQTELQLKPGHNEVDFTQGSSVTYTYTPEADQMLCFSNMQNVNIYTYSVKPDDKRYGDSFNGATYVQTQQGITYSIEVTKGWLTGESSFDLEIYGSPWPDGDTWDAAITATDKMSYLPVTSGQPVHVTYTAAEDGVLSVLFTAYVTVRYSTSQDGEFQTVSTSYQTGGGYKGSIDATAGQTYYFTVEAYNSMMCRFELLHPVVGASPEFPYTVTAGQTAVFPKEAGTYYYKIVNNGSDGYLLLHGDEPFTGTAKAGSSFTYATEESTDRIHIRMSVSSSYTEYCLVLTRDAEASADQTFTATFTEAPADIFPGESITAGSHTTPDFGGLYYYRFNLPGDGRNIISLKATGENLQSATKATLYFANNMYNSLASGTEIEFEADAAREYTVAWRVDPADAPLSFSLDFKAPVPGESPSNPIPARLGENQGQGSKAVYFQYTATLDGWLYITPDEGTGMPAVSMLPTPTDPYMQACEVIADGDSYRVASAKDRGYLIMFSTSDPVSFNLDEHSSLQGESPSFPFIAEGGRAEIPDSVGTFWFRYDAPRSGKMEISTDMAFTISDSRQDYSYVRIFAPADPDNYIAELRPDYDLHTFANRVMDTDEGTVYLIKVRTMDATAGRTVTLIVRDPVAGEVPELPIEIPFDGKSGQYTFDRPVNYPADAIWYGITLPEGRFTIRGTGGGTFEMNMYAPGNTDEPVAATSQLGVDYDEVNEMYIYTWGIADLDITEAGQYLLHVVDNAVPLTVDISIDAKDGISALRADAPRTDGVYHDLQGRRLSGKPAAAGVYIVNGRKVSVR